MNADPIAPVLLALALILAAGRLGADLASRLGQAAVLGELLVGVLLGNLDLAGGSGLDWIARNPSIDTLATLGVLILLFEVGLESTVRQMLRVGLASTLVAILGVAAPFGLGWAASALLLADPGPFTPAFIGATLTATSVGITARVLKDLARSETTEARIILGAAVIDDVLGLVILAVISGLIVGADRGVPLSAGGILAILGKSLGFLVGGLVLGQWLSPKLFGLAARLRSHGVLLSLSLAFCFILAWGASAVGLAPIVGAFAAGLILEQFHFQRFLDRGEAKLEDLLSPISSILVPMFFVLMGMRTDLRAFADPSTIAIAAALTLAAILGKQVCGLGVLGPADRVTIGIGMIPRGEVGLIFASLGTGLTVAGRPVLTPALFSALVVVVMVTTLVTPPLLKWSLTRRER